MTFKIITLGCKVNIYESELIKEQMLNNDFIESDTADIVIINTCSVTNNADSKSRKLIRKSKKENKDAIIVVCGCMSENHQNIYEDVDIDILIGNKDKSKLIDYIKNYIEDRKQIVKFYDEKTKDFEDMTIDKYKNKTRAFVKVQDGCDNYCTYCIIPYLRGNSRSKEFNKCLLEIKTLVENGHQEIVLTGIHTGNYLNNGKTLTDLIKEISILPNLKRLRISSIEITEIDDEFLKEIKTNDKICDHLHIPLQAGSESILKIMNRKYNLNEFKSIVDKIRNVRPNISLTTDVIVGFPGESEENFNDTIKFIKQIEFSNIHVFPYSVREGTVAEKLPGHLKGDVKKERSSILTKLSQELEINYYNKFINQEVEVLIEEVKDNYSVGHTSNYLKIKILEKLEKNQFYRIKITNITKNNIVGIVI